MKTSRPSTQKGWRLMSKWTPLCLLLTGIALAPSRLCAQGNVGSQGVTPQWTFSGRGLVSTPLVISGDDELEPKWHLLDMADTHLSTRVDSALYDDTIASFALGVRLTDADSPLSPAYLMQAEAALQGRYVAFEVGRRRRPSGGVSLPTLRDEDLLEFIYPLNPYSVAGLEEDAIFTDLISATFRLDFRWHAQLFIESLRNTEKTADPADRAGIRPNSGGLRLFYSQLPALHRVSVFREVGLGLYMQPDGVDGRKQTLWQLKADAALNLWPDAIHVVDVRTVALYQQGVKSEMFENVGDTWRTNYVSGALALRYLYAPYQLDRFQAAVNVGARRLIDQDGWEFIAIPNLVYRAGANVDVVAQYAYRHRSSELASLDALAGDEHRIELALSYTFSVPLYGTINLPRDLINADYNYVPVN